MEPKISEREVPSPTTPTPSSAPFNAAVAAAFERSAAAFGKNMRTFQQESARFMSKRAEENATAMERFASCKSLPDVFLAQQQWLADFTRSCNEEWMKYGELMGKMAKDSADVPAKPNGRN